MIKIIEACTTCTKITKSRGVRGEEIFGCELGNKCSRTYNRGKVIACSHYTSILDIIRQPKEIEAYISKMENERDGAVRNKSDPGLDYTNGVIMALNWTLRRKI